MEMNSPAGSPAGAACNAAPTVASACASDQRPRPVNEPFLDLILEANWPDRAASCASTRCCSTRPTCAKRSGTLATRRSVRRSRSRPRPLPAGARCGPACLSHRTRQQASAPPSRPGPARFSRPCPHQHRAAAAGTCWRLKAANSQRRARRVKRPAASPIAANLPCQRCLAGPDAGGRCCAANPMPSLAATSTASRPAPCSRCPPTAASQRGGPSADEARQSPGRPEPGFQRRSVATLAEVPRARPQWQRPTGRAASRPGADRGGGQEAVPPAAPDKLTLSKGATSGPDGDQGQSKYRPARADQRSRRPCGRALASNIEEAQAQAGDQQSAAPAPAASAACTSTHARPGALQRRVDHVATPPNR